MDVFSDLAHERQMRQLPLDDALIRPDANLDLSIRSDGPEGSVAEDMAEDEFPSEAAARRPSNGRVTLTSPTNVLLRQEPVSVPREPLGRRFADRAAYPVMAVCVVLAGAVGFLVAAYSDPGRTPQPGTDGARVETSAAASPAVGGAAAPVAETPPLADTPPSAAPIPGPDTVSSAREIPTVATRPERPIVPARPVETSPQGMSGWWAVTNRIESAAGEHLNQGYRLQLVQDGSRITGSGRQWMENGRQLLTSQQTAMSVDGLVEGATVTLRLVKRDAPEAGAVTFKYEMSDGVLRGRFSSDFAQSSGATQAHRMPAAPE